MTSILAEHQPDELPARRTIAAAKRRRSVAATTVVVAAYVALAVAMFWGVWGTNPAQVVQLGPDQVGSMWFLSWIPFALGHLHNPLFTNYANYPFGVNVLVNTSVPLLGLVAAPLTILWGPVASFNVLSTVALAGSATSAYFFVRRWTSWRPAAFVGGLLYGFGPYQIAESRAGHLNLTFVVLPPLILLLLHDLAVRQRGSAVRRGVVLGLAMTAQFFISSEVLATTLVMGAVLVVLLAIAGHRSVTSHLRYLVKGVVSGGVVAALLLVYPAWMALRGPGHIVGPIQDTNAFRANLLGPLVPDSFFRLAPSGLAAHAAHFSGSPGENGSYLGITLLIVAVVGAVLCWRLVVVRLAVVGGLVAFVLSLGSHLAVTGAPGPAQWWPWPLPGDVFAHLPVLDKVIPARFSLYQDLAMALLLAVILDRLWTWLAGWRQGREPAERVRAWVGAVTVAVVALVPLIPVFPFGGEVTTTTPAYLTSRALGRVPADSVALTYPFPGQRFPNPTLWQATSGLRFKLPGGYFLVPNAQGTLAVSLTLLGGRVTPTALALTSLQQGVTPPMTPANRAVLRHQLASWHVQTVMAFPEGTPNPGAAVAYLTWLVGRPPVLSHGAYLWYGVDTGAK